MLRTLFSVGAIALLGIFLLKIVFGLFGAALAIFFVVLVVALKILVFGAIIYFVIRIVSPGTAQSLREKFSGSSSSI